MGIICMVNLHNSTVLFISTYFSIVHYAVRAIPLPRVIEIAAEDCGLGPTPARIRSPKDGCHPTGHCSEPVPLRTGVTDWVIPTHEGDCRVGQGFVGAPREAPEWRHRQR